MKKDKFIKLINGIHDHLKGKVVDTYAFYTGVEDVEEESHLIIKFTDGTYICVGAVADDFDDYKIGFDNKYCREGSAYYEIPHYFSNGEVVLEKYFEDRITMGIINPVDTEMIKTIKNDKIARDKKKRYEEFLKLKKEFEPDDM